MFAAVASAAIVVQETFTYADGDVAGLNGGTGWASAWEWGNATNGSHWKVSSNQALFSGDGLDVTSAEQNRPFASAITVGVADTVTVQFNHILNETQAGRGCGIYLTSGGANQIFIGKKINGNVGLFSSMAGSGTQYVVFSTNISRTITATITYNGSQTSTVLSDGTETLAAHTFAGQLSFDGIALAGYHKSTVNNGVDELSVDVATVSAVNGAMLWTGAGVGDDTSTAANWQNTETGSAPSETPGVGLALIYTDGVIITNASACSGSLLCGDNAITISNVTATMQTGNLSGTSMSVTDAALSKGTATGLSITLNDNAVLQLSEGANPLDSTTVDLNSLSAQLKLDNETYADFDAEHASKVTAFGEVLQFGPDAFTQEPGDNAVATTINGGLGVQIEAVTVDITVPGALVWTDAGAFHGTGDVTNWLNTVSGTYPTETPDDAAGLLLYYTGGVIITNTGSCNGDLFVGSNTITIATVANQMQNGSVSCSSTMDITDASIRKTYVSGTEVTLNAGAVLELTGGGNPLTSGATVDLNASTAMLQFQSETWSDFNSEHSGKVTSFGAVLEFGSDPFVAEPGDNALASDFKAPSGVQITPVVDLGDLETVYEGFEGSVGSGIDGNGSGTGWSGNWSRFGGTAGTTVYTNGNGFTDGTTAVVDSGLAAKLSAAGDEDLKRSLQVPFTVGEGYNQYTNIWFTFLVDSSAGSVAAGHEFRLVLNHGGTDAVSFGKGSNKPWQLVTSVTNRSLTGNAGGSNQGSWLGVVHMEAVGSNTVVTGYLAEESDAGLDITEVSTFLKTGSITNSGTLSFDNVRIFSNNSDTTLVDEIRIAGTYRSSIGLFEAVKDPIGDIGIGPASGSGMVLSWDSSAGQIYDVQTNANLHFQEWGVYDTIVGDGGSVVVTTVVDQAMLFYKVTTP
jgi:hypothetical protein